MGTGSEWVRYGRPAAEALRRAIAEAKGGDPLAPVTVIVPSNHVGVAARRLLASGVLGPVTEHGSGIAAVTFLTVYRLGELLGSSRLANQGRRPVSTPVIGSAIRAELALSPGVFGPVATHPATETALVGTYRELRDLTDDALDALAAQSRRASDVIRLHRVARARLAPSWYDEEDLLDAAVDEVRTRGVAGLGHLIIYLPERITRHGADLVRAVGTKQPLHIVAGFVGVARADAEAARSVERLGGTPTSPQDGVNPMSVVDVERTRIVTVSDADEEVRAALRTVIAAVRDGVPLDRIAILIASAEPYARLAYEQFTAGGVPVNGTAIMPLTARLAARALLGLLALPDGSFRREEVFAWLAGAPILNKGRWTPVAAWERISREAGIVAGRMQWDQLLTRVVDVYNDRADAKDRDPESSDWEAELARTAARQAQQLREFILHLIDDLDQAAKAVRTWPEWAQWARGHLATLLDGERAREDKWPSPEKRAAERVESAIDRLACLEGVEGPVGLDVFTRTLQLELDANLGRVGRMGEGVLIAPVSMGVGLDLDLAVVLGLAEGVYPRAPRDDSLLPDHERSVAGDELTLRSARVERQHREFLAALAGSARHLLCVPRGDLRGSKELVPSRWVLQAASSLDGKPWYSEDLLDPHKTDLPWLTHVASFDAGLRASTFPASDQEYRLRALLSDPAGSNMPIDPIYAGGSNTIELRRSRRFTRFDGNLVGLHLPSPANSVTSATRLETWATCPFAYLLKHLLGIGSIENPEEELTITPLTRGTLVHGILEEFIEGALADHAAPEGPWSQADRVRLRSIAERECTEYEAGGLTGRPIFWRRDRRRILADLERTFDDDNAFRISQQTVPVAAELAFGFRNADLGEVRLELPDGRAIGFRGKADRVDVSADGTLYVIDYKTGSTTGHVGLSETNPDMRGHKLQLPIYGLAARALRSTPNAPVRADYWFVSSKGGFKRIGYDVNDAVLDHFGQTLAKIVEGIEGGVFPAYPTGSSTTPTRWIECPYCDPDGLGVIELRRAWERKALDSDMAAFMRLIADDVESEDHDGTDGND